MMVVFAMIICGFLVALTGLLCWCGSYCQCLRRAKRRRRYQSMTFHLVKTICHSVGAEYFVWDRVEFGDNTELLFYINPGKRSINRLIDLPFIDMLKLRTWLWFDEKRKVRRSQQLDIESNKTNDVLQNVQSILEEQIATNQQQMQEAAAEQKKIVERLGPFMRDYLKSQIKLEG